MLKTTQTIRIPKLNLAESVSRLRAVQFSPKRTTQPKAEMRLALRQTIEAEISS